ncbi:YkgJ family cysteine cluster protein [Aquitalea magnusonii]|uniref:Putative zinc-or iron-chelating protein n=1 Tax=Aquitalea magnusonii TaxID=332411 RepID=A0A318JMD5_9NEIS|nr:YkgJ family cysteine cluster protein [Aquitalea magnusonii]PXX51090.1 putative zinc- or iron-chelating protein [Aquitalea magnusonii]
MLHADEAAALQASIERVGARVTAALQDKPGVDYAVAFVGNLHRGIDQTMAQAALRGEPVACRAGCASCCSLRVEVAPAEALLIARQLRSGPAERLAQLRQALQRQQSVLAQEGAIRPPCAFLQDALCSIYPWRPASCRKAHSFSAEACQSGAAQLPQDLAITLAAEALQRGTALGYRQRGLDGAVQELSAAVLQALADDTAASRWYAAADNSTAAQG